MYCQRVSVFLLSNSTPKSHISALYYTVVCGLSSCAIYSLIFSIKHDFRKKTIACKRIFLIISTTMSEIHLITGKIQQDINLDMSSCKVGAIQ